jgi:hypothetical protein
MSLLREIQHAAIDTKTPVSAVLLMCQLLTSRLSYEPLSTWVDKELNGYAGDDDLPDYRNLGNVPVLGQTSGPWGSGATNLPIPFTIVEQKHWDELFKVELKGGIAGYEHLAASDQDSFAEQWPAHLIQYYGQEPITTNGQHLVDAKKVIAKGAIVAMLSTIRSRVLKLATDLERENPGAGDAVPGTDPGVSSQSLQRLTTTVYGNASFVTSGGGISADRGSVIGAPDGDVITGGQKTVGDTVTTQESVHVEGERTWFARHPWIAGLLVAVVAGVPAIYITVLGFELPW